MLIRSDARCLPIRSGIVQTVVTSPPYWGLRDYQANGQIGLERTPEEYVENMVAVFREVWRVLRDDGTVWLNLGDSYAGSWGAQGGPSNLGLPPSGVYQAKSPGRNAGNCGLKPKDLVGIPWRVAFALQADGWYLRSDIIWAKPNPMPESVTDRPTKAHEYVFLLAKQERYYYDADAIREPHSRNWLDSTGLGGNTGVKKLTLTPTDPNWRNGHSQWESNHDVTMHEAGRNRRSVWTIATDPYAGAHFATFPPKLIEPMILAGSRLGDIVLDPFVGSGTAVMVARGLGRIGVGCDLKYQELSAERIYGPLFAATINA